MVNVVEALRAHGETGAAIVELLYGDGAEEVAKALSQEQKSERLQNRVAMGSNVVGIAAGVAGTKEAYSGFRAKRNALKGVTEGAPKVGRFKALNKVGAELKKPRTAALLAGGALALQAGNVAGDAVTNRVISRAKKREGVAKSDEHDIEWTGEIAKSDDDKRQVFGWASVTKVNGVLVEDLQGDEIELEEIEKAAYDYVQTSRKGGNMHQKTADGPVHVSDLIESLVVTPEKAEALHINGGNEGWWVGFQVKDDETWQAHKRGELVGFSIHGKGKRA